MDTWEIYDTSAALLSDFADSFSYCRTRILVDYIVAKKKYGCLINIRIVKRNPQSGTLDKHSLALHVFRIKDQCCLENLKSHLLVIEKCVWRIYMQS